MLSSSFLYFLPSAPRSMYSPTSKSELLLF
jgi:hypothetical protein